MEAFVLKCQRQEACCQVFQADGGEGGLIAARPETATDGSRTN